MSEYGKCSNQTGAQAVGRRRSVITVRFSSQPVANVFRPSRQLNSTFLPREPLPPPGLVFSFPVSATLPSPEPCLLEVPDLFGGAASPPDTPPPKRHHTSSRRHPLSNTPFPVCFCTHATISAQFTLDLRSVGARLPRPLHARRPNKSPDSLNLVSYRSPGNVRPTQLTFDSLLRTVVPSFPPVAPSSQSGATLLCAVMVVLASEFSCLYETISF